MSTIRVPIAVEFDALLEVIDNLSESEKLIIRQRLDTVGHQVHSETRKSPRIPDLFPGIWTSDDFDDELPDEFWLGEDA